MKPMLLTETYDMDVLNKKRIFQEKFNGIRCLVHVKHGEVVGMRSRSNNPILYIFPEFRGKKLFPFEGAILDTEICVMKDGKSVFYNGIDKRRSQPTDKVLKQYPATMVVFDVLVAEKDVRLKPYSERYEIISKIQESDVVQVAKNYDNGHELWEKVKKENREGIVIKNPNTTYQLDTRSKELLKLKNYKITEIVVEKTEPNEKGTKIFGKFGDIDVECQLGGIFDVEIGSTQTIKYLDIYGKRLIQPTKVSRTQKEVYDVTK